MTALIVLMSVAGNGLAQDVSQAQREHEQRLREQQERDQERLRRDRATPDVFLQPAPDKSAPQLPSSEAAPCVDIKSIAVQGVTAFDDEIINAMTRTYSSRCLLLSDINHLIADISNLYLDKGYITSRAFVQPQKIEKGTLDVLVVEGEIEVLKSGDGRMKQSELSAAFPDLGVSAGKRGLEKGENKNILYLRDLEQGIEQLNRLQYNSAKLDIQPGKDVGQSIVNVMNDRRRPLHGSFAADNSGSGQTGEYLLSASVFWDNPIYRSDSLSFNYSRSVKAAKDGQSQSAALNYSIPQGYFLWSVGANQFDYRQTITGAAIDFATTGESGSQNIRLDHVAFRGQQSKVSWNVGAVRKDTQNYIEDVFLETSSRTLYLGNLGVATTYQWPTVSLRGGLVWTRSMAIGNATQEIAAAEADYQFNKFDLNVGVSGRFDSFGQRFQYSSSLHYFYTPTTIVASEALALGGRYTIRGFDHDSVTVFKGGYLRSDLSAPLLFDSLRLEPFIGYDLGQGDAPDYQESKVTLSGASVGLRCTYRSLYASVTYSKALSTPDFLDQGLSEVAMEMQIGF